MDQSFLEIVVLAFIAGFALFRLYMTLGKRPEEDRSAEPAPAQGSLPREQQRIAQTAQSGAGPTGEGIMAILRADPTFDVEHFMAGARAAYELIVGAFAKGDRAALEPLLTERVYKSYAEAISVREAGGGKGPELVRLKSLELVDAALEGSIARVVVKFEAELAEGAHGVRDARERWTFERDVRSDDPNWRLARVAAA